MRTGDHDPLAALTRWNYAVTYSLQVHREQDEVRGQIVFNLAGSSSARLRAADRDIFDNLAQFTQTSPRVLADLDQYLVPVDVATTDPTTLQNAQTALQSAATMIEWLAASPPQMDPGPVALGRAAAVLPVGFTVAEDAVDTPLRPTLVCDDEIDIATVFTSGSGVAQRRTLLCQLQLMYEALFANAGTDSVTMQLGLYHAYDANAALTAVRLPVYLMPPTRTAIRDGGEGESLAAVVQRQVDGWSTWFAANRPATTGAGSASTSQ